MGYITLQAGTYLIKGCPYSNPVTWGIRVGKGKTWGTFVKEETGEGVVLTFDTETTINLTAEVFTGSVASGQIFAPCVEVYSKSNVQITNELANMGDQWTSRTYSVGEYAIYNNVLWKCKVANSSAPSEGANWTAVKIANEIKTKANLLNCDMIGNKVLDIDNDSYSGIYRMLKGSCQGTFPSGMGGNTFILIGFNSGPNTTSWGYGVNLLIEFGTYNIYIRHRSYNDSWSDWATK